MAAAVPSRRLRLARRLSAASFLCAPAAARARRAAPHAFAALGRALGGGPVRALRRRATRHEHGAARVHLRVYALEALGPGEAHEVSRVGVHPGAEPLPEVVGL